MYAVHNQGHFQYNSNRAPGTLRRFRCWWASRRFNRLLKIPFVTNMYASMDPSITIPLEKIHIDADIKEGVSFTKFMQIYKNTTKNPIECTYKFPSSDSYLVSGVSIKSGDTVIETEIIEKEQANHKYDDAVAAGNTAIQMKIDEEKSDIISINVGYIPPEQEVVVTVSFIYKLESVNKGYYSYIFPYELIPGARKYARMRKHDEEVIAKFNWEFSMDVKIWSESEISNINCSHKVDHKFTKDNKEVSVSMNTKTTELESDIIISYTTDDIRTPKIHLFSDQKAYKDEVAAHISFVPRLSEEIKVDESVDEESKSFVEEENIHDSDITSGEFIFIFDRSHSMGGSRIQAARKALELFIKSLPIGSKFNIVSFGKEFYKFFEESAEFNEVNMQQVLDSMDEFKANMGGTNILAPLKAIYEELNSK